MSASAGRVLLKPKGPYNALTAYTPLDYVTYTDGNTYVCHTPTTGHAPTDTNYWQILVDNSGVVHTVDIANDLTTQTAGKVLDARQGYALNTSLANKQDKPIVYSVTTSNVSSVRFPASGTDSNITTSSKVVAFASDNSGKPQKYSAINVYAGYVQITLPTVNTSTVTYEVHIYN
jgi:hypothetical protein